MTPSFYCFLLFILGVLIILPNIYSVRHLQNGLLSRLLRLPSAVLQSLAIQADRRVATLRKYNAVGAVDDDAAHSSSDDEPDGEGAALLFGDAAGGRGDEDAAGGVHWGAVLEAITAPGSDAQERPIAIRFQWCISPGLLLFFVPCLVLIPFYITLYATSTSAVNDIVTSMSFYSMASSRVCFVSVGNF